MTIHQPLDKPLRSRALKVTTTARLWSVRLPPFRSFVGALPLRRQLEHWHGRVMPAPYARVTCAACLKRGMAKAEFEQRQLDLIVVHSLTGRPLGRPWMTMHFHRITRIVLDVRLNSEVCLRS